MFTNIYDRFWHWPFKFIIKQYTSTHMYPETIKSFLENTFPKRTLYFKPSTLQRLFHSFHNVLPYISDETYHLWNKYTKWLILPSFQITRIFTNIKLNTKYIIQNCFMSLFKTATKPSFLCKCNYEFSWCIKKKQKIHEWCQNNP